MGPVKAQHGFARNTEFTVVNATADSVTLSLSPNEEQRQGHCPDHTLYVKVHPFCSAQALLLITCKSASAILVPAVHALMTDILFMHQTLRSIYILTFLYGSNAQ